MRNRRPGAGLWLAFFGPDGAGKSGVIQRLEVCLGRSFVSTRRYHLRPHFRATQRLLPPVTNPHGKPPRGTLLSVAKLLMWFADCWAGHLLIVRPAIKSGGLVMFDRYFHDILIDPRRYRLPESALGFVRLLLKLMPIPNLCIVLDAPAEILQKRKTEVPFVESHRQRNEYLRLFNTQPNSLLIDASLPMDDVALQIGRVVGALTGTALQRQLESECVSR